MTDTIRAQVEEVLRQWAVTIRENNELPLVTEHDLATLEAAIKSTTPPSDEAVREALERADEAFDMMEYAAMVACDQEHINAARAQWGEAIATLEAAIQHRGAVIEAARRHMTAWDAMEEAVEYRRGVLYEEQHGQFISDTWKAELAKQQMAANAEEHRTADALRAALATHDGGEGE